MSATAATTPTTSKPAMRSHATKLVNLMTNNGAEFFHTPDGQPYVTVTIAGHCETMSLTGTTCRDYLAREYFLATKKAATASALKDALNVLCATAYTRPEHPVFVRLARTDDAIWLDLGRPEWSAVKVTANGWSVVATPDVRFRRPRGLLALPVPTHGSESITTLLPSLVNVHDERDLQLMTGWLVGAIRGKAPYPILSVNGEQGSAKSTACRTLRRFIDPNTADLRSTPKEPRDLMIMAKNVHIIAFDNLSHIPDWLSDDLCRLATGAGFSTRQLYSDDDEILFAAARPVLVNGITEIITRPDLLSRALVVTLEPIPDDKRRSESELDAKFNEAHPAMLGALLDAVSMALQNEPTTKLATPQRMVDFETWVTAAEPALGQPTGTFSKAYGDNQQTAIVDSLDGDVVVETIRGLKLPWSGQLKALLNEMPDGEHRPKSPRALGNALRRQAPALRAVGIHVEFKKRTHGERRIEIWSTSPTRTSSVWRLSLPLREAVTDGDTGVHARASPVVMTDASPEGELPGFVM